MLRFLLSPAQCLAAAFVLVASTVAVAQEEVLVIGGAGNSGSAIARMLIDRGYHVTAFVRHTTTSVSGK